MQRFWKRVLIGIGVLALLVVLGAGWVAYSSYCYLTVIVPDAYAVWYAADLIVAHMETRDGAWPKGWDDLREFHEKGIGYHGWGLPFEEIQNRVEVDWDADPALLVEAKQRGSGPPFRVIWLRDGHSYHWSHNEPNAIVLWHLKKRAERGK